ncbi:hypothetical protein F5Y12DRAFT_762074 [Xylaria sp. FL1777]|nr:hypothetical protein F5Y12DRAFT_762074 [Xylaria sp. FL1777]
MLSWIYICYLCGLWLVRMTRQSQHPCCLQQLGKVGVKYVDLCEHSICICVGNIASKHFIHLINLLGRIFEKSSLSDGNGWICLCVAKLRY